jgi:hypothetical protein
VGCANASRSFGYSLVAVQVGGTAFGCSLSQLQWVVAVLLAAIHSHGQNASRSFGLRSRSRCHQEFWLQFGCSLSRLHWVIALLLIAVGCTAELVALGCTAFDCSRLHGRVGCTGWLHFF